MPKSILVAYRKLLCLLRQNLIEICMLPFCCAVRGMWLIGIHFHHLLRISMLDIHQLVLSRALAILVNLKTRATVANSSIACAESIFILSLMRESKDIGLTAASLADAISLLVPEWDRQKAFCVKLPHINVEIDPAELNYRLARPILGKVFISILLIFGLVDVLLICLFHTIIYRFSRFHHHSISWNQFVVNRRHNGLFWGAIHLRRCSLWSWKWLICQQFRFYCLFRMRSTSFPIVLLVWVVKQKQIEINVRAWWNFEDSFVSYFTTLVWSKLVIWTKGLLSIHLPAWVGTNFVVVVCRWWNSLCSLSSLSVNLCLDSPNINNL